MSWESQANPIEVELQRLAVGDVDPARVERIRLHCVSVLARRRQKGEARREGILRWGERLELAAAAGLALLYLAGAVERVLQILS